MNCHLAITRVKFVYLIDACVLRRKLNRRFHNREFTQRQEYDHDYVNGCLKGLGLIVIVIVSLNVWLTLVLYYVS